jgi:hypothetical protein
MTATILIIVLSFTIPSPHWSIMHGDFSLSAQDKVWCLDACLIRSNHRFVPSWIGIAAISAGVCPSSAMCGLTKL